MLANILMSIGILPLGFCVVWLAGLLAWLSGHRPIVPIMDPLGMIGPSILSYIITFAIAGTSAAWSWDLSLAHPEHRSRIAPALRLLTAAILVSPFALLIALQILARFS